MSRLGPARLAKIALRLPFANKNVGIASPSARNLSTCSQSLISRCEATTGSRMYIWTRFRLPRGFPAKRTEAAPPGRVSLTPNRRCAAASVFLFLTRWNIQMIPFQKQILQNVLRIFSDEILRIFQKCENQTSHYQNACFQRSV
jgi:hypothetical protein